MLCLHTTEHCLHLDSEYPPVQCGQVPGEGCAHKPASLARQQHAGPAASPSAALPVTCHQDAVLFLLCACALHICGPAINWKKESRSSPSPAHQRTPALPGAGGKSV